MYVVDDNKWSFYDILKKTHRMDTCSMTNCPMSSRAPPHIPPKKPPRCPSTLKWPTILRFAWQPDAWWLPHILKPLGNSYSKCGYLRVDIYIYIWIYHDWYLFEGLIGQFQLFFCLLISQTNHFSMRFSMHPRRKVTSLPTPPFSSQNVTIWYPIMFVLINGIRWCFWGICLWLRVR